MPEPAAKILVADDDQSLVRTLTWILKENGYDVVTAPGGEGLIGKLEEERPNLLLLDIMMPKVDGLQLLAKMKADDRFRDVPVLMLSSMPPEEATVKSLGLGAADFISKPFRVRELLARVKAHIRSAQELARARDEAQSRAAIVDILHEVTDSLKPDEIYHILVRRVGAPPFSKEGQAAGVFLPPHRGGGPAAHARRRPVRRNGDPHRRGGDREGVRFRDGGVGQEAPREAGGDRRAHGLPEPARALGRARGRARSGPPLQPGAHHPARRHRPVQARERHAGPHPRRLP